MPRLDIQSDILVTLEDVILAREAEIQRLLGNASADRVIGQLQHRIWQATEDFKNVLLANASNEVRQ